MDPNSQQEERMIFWTPIRLNADNSNKKAIFLFWIIFALFEITVLITSNFTPETFVFKTNESQLANTKYKECLNPIEFDKGLLSCQKFSLRTPKVGLIMRNLSPMNQFAQINLLFIPKNQTSTTLTIEQNFKVQLMSLKRKEMTLNENQKVTVFQKGQQVKTIDNFSFDSTDYKIQEIKWSQNTIKYGYEVKLGYYREFQTQDGLLIITFLNLSQQYIDSYDIQPQAILMNTNYTIFIIILRAVFLGVMSLTFAIYLSKIRQTIPCIEQKIVLVLSGFSIFFNDPYYFIEVFKPNVFCLFLSTTFVCTFLIALVMSWICMLEKIKYQIEGLQFQFSRYTMIKYSLIAGSYFFIVFFFIFEVTYYAFSQSPIIPAHSTFNLLYIGVVILFTLIFLYILWLYAHIIKEWKNVIWRDKIYSTFNIFFILLNLLFIFLGWFSFYDESSQKFQIFYASMNLYVIYLQYMYSTPFETKEEKKQDHEKLTEESDQEVTTYMEEGCITIDLEQNQKEVKPKLSDYIEEQ